MWRVWPREQLLARLPEFRPTRFQQALPGRVAVEMVRASVDSDAWTDLPARRSGPSIARV
jgi:hypothetical protein